MAKYDGLDGYCNISEKYINLYSQAVDYFQKNDLAQIAKQKGWSNGEMFEALISPLKGLRGDFQRCFSFSIPTEKAKTKSGNFASPAAFTYVVTMGLKTRDDNTCELTPIGKYLIEKRLSVQSYSLLILSKVGVYDRQDQENRISNLLTVFCKYAIKHPNEEYDSEAFEKVVSSVGIIDARTDISFNALVISGLLSITNNGEYQVLSQDLPIIKEVADHGDTISGPKEDAQSFMGTFNKSILEIVNQYNSKIFSNKYADLVKIKGIEPVMSQRYVRPVQLDSRYTQYLTAIRTKPFLLLAGISGTGKSRIVRKLAQATNDIDFKKDDNSEDRWKKHNPTNFCLIQVKPNWHNSMDVVGFKSNIGCAHYEFTPFIEFIAKAWHYPDTPFFLCLDEMNLAPVEEYFAEFLSAIESRSLNKDGVYETDPIVNPFDSFGPEVSGQMIAHLVNQELDTDCKLENQFRKKGLTLPKNLIVMGTVNMDETTFSFSRKVLDRAMSIEMNEVNYDAFLSGATEEDVPLLSDCNMLLVDRPINAQIVKGDIEADKIIDYLKNVNALLEGTPFKLGYRAANEAFLYVSASKMFGSDDLGSALDKFTVMKILSRIEGDDSKLKTKSGDDLLPALLDLLSNQFGEDGKSISVQKLTEMNDILTRDHFVSFWG